MILKHMKTYEKLLLVKWRITNPRAIQQINFAANLDRPGNTNMFFIIEEAKETVLDFLQGTAKLL